jgi:hypothetical protein
MLPTGCGYVEGATHDSMSKKSNQFSPEVRERAVRMVLEHRGEYPSLWAAFALQHRPDT